MPIFIWSGIASVAGIVAGMIYEKESNKKIVESVSDAATGGLPWDKILMAAAGVAAYWIYRSTK